jgi:hypothetical protein
VWEGLKAPLQVVHRRVELPLEQRDWRALAEPEQARQLDDYLRADRRRGFELSRAPLLRVALLRVGETTYQFVWSFHHLLLDGWSGPLLLKELFGLYEGACRGEAVQLPPVRPYRDYIAWLKRQDLGQAEAYWRRVLKGFRAPTPLGVDRGRGGGPGTEGDYGQQELRLSKALTERVQGLARREGLTLNTLVQGAWAVLLSRYSGEEEVLFGVTVAGRPAELAGVEVMVGLFINTLPLRVQVAGGSQLLPWLKGLQAQQVELRQYEYSPLAQVQGWSEVPRGSPFFESIVVFENYPIDASLKEQGGTLTIHHTRSFEQSNYPIDISPAVLIRL